MVVLTRLIDSGLLGLFVVIFTRRHNSGRLVDVVVNLDGGM